MKFRGRTFFLLFAAGHLPEFLLPFRKPKRIRTAFSPSQLLKLEQAFEKNQYVVGAERKELAKNLNLSETQVRQTDTSRGFAQPSKTQYSLFVQSFARVSSPDKNAGEARGAIISIRRSLAPTLSFTITA